ncbi:LV136 protein, partial [Polypterus senegalus]
MGHGVPWVTSEDAAETGEPYFMGFLSNPEVLLAHMYGRPEVPPRWKIKRVACLRWTSQSWVEGGQSLRGEVEEEVTTSNGQKVLTQSAVVPGGLRQTVTMGCNVQRDGNSVSWLKQVPGSPPQHILRFYYSWSAPDEYGTGFSSSRFTSKASNNKIDYQLIISDVEGSDSAVYYCYTWDSSVSSWVSQ